MKYYAKLLVLAYLIFLSVALSGQTYKKFKCLIAIGHASTSGGTYNPSGSFFFQTIEPAFHIRDNLTVGLRAEGAAYSHLSATANSQYYFGVSDFRPFVGAGVGMYEVANGGGYGFYPRVGFDFGHVSISMDYNIISPAVKNGDEITSYFGIRAGAFFGGGKN